MGTDVKDVILRSDENLNHALYKAYAQFGRKSSRVKRLCERICGKIKETSSDIILVWPGYNVISGAAKKSITFVAVTENEDRGYKKILGFDVLVCKQNTCNDEGRIVMDSQQMKEKPFTGKELKQLQQCLSKYSPKLMSSHSNIEIMTACSVKSTHFRENDGVPDLSNKTCIVLYVNVKGIVPLQEEEFPEQIWGFPVDVREGCFVLCGGPNEYHETLKMGCEIGRDPQSNNGGLGTLGAFIENNSGDLFCLTSAHVLLNGDEMRELQQSGGRKIYDPLGNGVHQPVRNPSGTDDRFGALVEAIHDTGGEHNAGMEIAVVKIQHRHPDSGEFPDGNVKHAGFSASLPMVFNSGEILHSKEFIDNQGTTNSEVVKYGSTTKVTRGSFALVGTAVRTRDYSFMVGSSLVEVHGQIEISKIGETKFAELGDSGAMVFGFFENKKAYLRPVGILTGLTDYGGAIITPISCILDKLGVKQLKRFPSNSYPEPMTGIDDMSSNQHVDRQLETMRQDIKGIRTDMEKNQIETKLTLGNMEAMMKEMMSNIKK